MLKQNRRLHPNAVRWMIRYASKVRNRYESAHWIWVAMDGEKPLSMRRLCRYFGWQLI